MLYQKGQHRSCETNVESSNPVSNSGAQIDKLEGRNVYEYHSAKKGNQYGGVRPLVATIAQYKPEDNATRVLLYSVPDELYPLGFYTLTAHPRIHRSKEYLRYGSIDRLWEPNGRVVFLLHHIRSQTSSYVLLDQSWKTRFSRDQSYEFPMLSEANYECQWRRPHEYHPYKTQKFYDSYECYDSHYVEFHVMMIV